MCYIIFEVVNLDISIMNSDANAKLNVRVAGLIMDSDKVLLQTCDNVDFYSLPGGRVKYMEDSLCALKRELNEELGMVVNDKDINLIDILENFFIFNDVRYHEYLFIYKINNSYNLTNKDNFKTLDKSSSINSWHTLDEIKELNIKPDIIKKLVYTKRLRHDIMHEENA